MNKKRIWRNTLILLAVAVFLVLLLGKMIRLNPLLAQQYVLDGVDVSHYQGEIDWERLAEQGIDFAYIKATEGSRFEDDYFAFNWQQAEEAGLYVGAYHFFSFDSEPQIQAEHFMEVTGEMSGRLVPAVDVEYYGDLRKKSPEKDKVVQDLEIFLLILEEQYQVRPVIYTTMPFYDRYLRGNFDSYPLWIRNVYTPPFGLGREWQFWQYTDTAVMEGYSGEEKYIDRNVFYGTEKDLETYLIPFLNNIR